VRKTPPIAFLILRVLVEDGDCVVLRVPFAFTFCVYLLIRAPGCRSGRRCFAGFKAASANWFAGQTGAALPVLRRHLRIGLLVR